MARKIGTAKISNSYRGMEFTINKSDIENGQPNDPCACAAARALKRQFQAKEVFVFRDVTYILRKDNTALRYHTSPQLRLETIVYDRNGEFYPGQYELQPAPVAAPKSKRSSKGSSSARRTNRPRVRHVIPNVRPTASVRLPRV